MASNTLPSRGAGVNPPNRFEKIHIEPTLNGIRNKIPCPAQQFLKDKTSTIIAYNDSPDVGFEASVNHTRVRTRLYLLLRPAIS